MKSKIKTIFIGAGILSLSVAYLAVQSWTVAENTKPRDNISFVELKQAILSSFDMKLDGGGGLVEFKPADNVSSADDKNLSIGGNMIVGKNQQGAVSNAIGGGESNSANINDALATILGGIRNVAQGAYSLVMGGDSNQINGYSTGSSIGGGSGNQIQASIISLIGGGEGNTIDGGKNNTILGMKNNNISNGENNIIAGQNVRISGLSNTFVRSDTDFQPTAGNAFYIQATNGVGINNNNPQSAFDTNGAIKIGINSDAYCDDTNVGVITAYTSGVNTCVCGCGQNGWRNLTKDVANSCSNVCSELASSIIYVDDLAPTALSVIIDGGAIYTNLTSRKVTLTLSATDNVGVTEMCIGNNNAACTREPYTTSTGWTLVAGNGLKTVKVNFRDEAGNESTKVSDTIILDNVKPIVTAVSYSPAQISNSTVRVTISGTDATAGIANTNGYSFDNGSTWQTNNYKDFTSSVSNNVQVKDNAGNISAATGFSVTIVATQSASCIGLPTNAVWNSVSSISQTWNGTAWTPSATGSYNATASASECRYKCATGYERRNNACESDPYADLSNGVHTIDNTIAVAYNGQVIVIADRNVGATAAYNGSNCNSTSNYAGCGKYYQRGNNYGRTAADTITTTSTQVNDTSSYGPGNRYSNSTFNNNPQRSKSFTATVCDTGNNIRGGKCDTTSSNSGPLTNAQRGGPCPTGFHVPSTKEWLNLANLWLQTKGKSTISAGGSFSWSSSATKANWQTDLKLPPAGNRNPSLTSIGSNGYYWSSSPNADASTAYNLYFRSANLYPQYTSSRLYGFSLRCFQDS